MVYFVPTWSLFAGPVTFLRSERKLIHVTTDQYYSHVFAQKFQNIYNISQHLDHHGVLCHEQHGFHQKRSCETQLITTINDFAECLNQNSQFNALLLDFSRAFDKVAHTHLFHKLSHHGIQGTLLL